MIIDDRGPDVSGYLATYILPLVVITEPTVADQVAYGLFLVVVGVIYVQSRMIQVNPMFNLFNYRLHMVEGSTEGYRGYLLTQGEARESVSIRTVRLREKLLLEIPNA